MNLKDVAGRGRKYVIDDMKLNDAVKADIRTPVRELADSISTSKSTISIHLNILGKKKTR